MEEEEERVLEEEKVVKERVKEGRETEEGKTEEREEGTPEHFLNSVLARYEEEVMKEQGRQREASRVTYREKARWRVGKVREGSQQKGGVIDSRWKGVLVTDDQLNKEKEKRDNEMEKEIKTEIENKEYKENEKKKNAMKWRPKRIQKRRRT